MRLENQYVADEVFVARWVLDAAYRLETTVEMVAGNPLVVKETRVVQERSHEKNGECKNHEGFRNNKTESSCDM